MPERLCNFICSLRPNEDKLTYSVIFDLNDDAEIKASRIVHTIIRSNRRYAYEEAQQVLEDNGVVDGTGKPAPNPERQATRTNTAGNCAPSTDWPRNCASAASRMAR